MASEVDICNIALSSIGSDTIRAFDQSTKRARVCETMYPHIRDTLLSQYDWSFARSVIALRETVGADVLPIGMAYDMPVDCLRPIDIYPVGSRQAWEIIGTSLYTRVAEPILRYTKVMDTTGTFTSSFVNALAMVVAYHIAPAIRQDKSLEKGFEARAIMALRLAQEEDAGRGSEYIHSDNDPRNDSFVNPDAAQALLDGTWYGDFNGLS